MIEKCSSFKTSDGTVHASIAEAQRPELESLLNDNTQLNKDMIPNVAAILMSCRDAIVDLLTTKATSRPKARKANGATRTKKTAVKPAQEPAK